ESARNACLGHAVHFVRRIRLAVQFEVSRGPRGKRGNYVEERGLAGAVGADQSVDLAARNLDADIRQRLQTAEALVDTGDSQDDVRHYALCGTVRPTRLAGLIPCSGAGHNPFGRYSMIST